MPASVERAIAQVAEVARLAPDPIAADAATVADSYKQTLQALSVVAPSAREEVLRNRQAELDLAAEPTARLNEYAQRTCGLSLSPAAVPPTPTAVPTAAAGLEG